MVLNILLNFKFESCMLLSAVNLPALFDLVHSYSNTKAKDLRKSPLGDF